ncbi:MAG TPA: prolyl oligopeptidase family serine peptidase [Rhodanobacteraceae bacterium]
MASRRLHTLAALVVSLAWVPAAVTAGQATTPSASGSATTTSWLLPINDFARHSTVGDPSLSPDGKHLLVSMASADGTEHALVIYQLSDMSIVSEMRMPIHELPLDPMWVSNDWIVFSIGKHLGSLDEPSDTGQVVATNLHGTRQNYLYGYMPGFGRHSGSRTPDDGEGFIVGGPAVPNGHVYVRAELFNRENLSILYDIDAAHNTRHLVAQIGVAGMDFAVNPAGKAVYAYGDNAQFQFVVYRHTGINDGWVKLKPGQMGGFFNPLAFTPDHQHVYALISPQGKPDQLVSEALDGSQRKVLASNGFASEGDIQWTAMPYRPFAAAPQDGVPQPTFFDAKAPDSKLYRALQKVFPNEAIDFINFDQDGGKLLFSVYSDRDPGSYYLINTHTFKVKKLFSAAPWINPKLMATRYPFHFKASDGMELSGILTFPLHRKQQNLPMVVVPHGGPYGIRDDWSFDYDAQFLANRGYLVLQVNYRGSGGRGVGFKHAGYRKWGTRIQQDIIDGVKWTIAHHLANPDRICVYGGSFGGYSALMQVIRAPKLYKCAIGYAGVYDLPMLLDKGNVQSTESGQSYLATVLGHDMAKLKANSPVDLVDKIHVPVFLVHGKDDNQAPYAGAKEMRSALEDAHKPFQWLALSHEGHGFYSAADRAKLLTQMQAFLAKYIGPGAPPVTPTH